MRGAPAQKPNRAPGKDLMNFIGLRRAVFRSLVAFSLAFAPLCGTSLIDTALASVLDSDSLRVLPVIGKGTLADLRDLGNFGLGDLALLQSDSLANLPRDEREAVSARLAYVARLYNEEVHIVAARDVTDLRQL